MIHYTPDCDQVHKIFIEIKMSLILKDFVFSSIEKKKQTFDHKNHLISFLSSI